MIWSALVGFQRSGVKCVCLHGQEVVTLHGLHLIPLVMAQSANQITHTTQTDQQASNALTEDRISLK